MDTEGKILPAGQSGELCTRGTKSWNVRISQISHCNDDDKDEDIDDDDDENDDIDENDDNNENDDNDVNDDDDNDDSYE